MPPYQDETEAQILTELLELRQAVAEALGRRQYVYRLIDEAVHSGHEATMRSALSEFAQQPQDVTQRVRGVVKRSRVPGSTPCNFPMIEIAGSPDCRGACSHR